MIFWRWGLIVAALSSRHAHAYLQYAVRYNQATCVVCHYSPTGGGPKTLNGKLFGTHGLKFNPLLAQKYVSVDFRTIYYLPSETAKARDGLGVMSGSVAAHAALDADERAVLVVEHNVAGFSSAPYRDTYALFHLPPKYKWLSSVAVGRLRMPFGIVTDEHRTYTRIQTGTQWYSLDTGVLLSGDPADSWHYDLAVVNGTHSSGAAFSSAGQAGHWGSVLNVRYLRRPYLAGVSGNYYKSAAPGPRTRAVSTYGGFTWSRWTLLGEFVRAEGFSSNYSHGFASNSAYVDSLSRAVSLGWLALLEYEFSQHLYAIYKFDLLTPDRAYPADQYQRHGFGVRWNLAPFVWLQARLEKAQATHPSEKQGLGAARMDAAFALLQIVL